MIDAGQLEAAGKHLDRALTLAGISQDPDMTMQDWRTFSDGGWGTGRYGGCN